MSGKAWKMCECGNIGVYKIGSDFECERCHELAKRLARGTDLHRQVHPLDASDWHLTGPERAEATEHRRLYQITYNAEYRYVLAHGGTRDEARTQARLEARRVTGIEDYELASGRVGV